MTEYEYVVYPEIVSFPTRHEAAGYAAVRERQFELWDYEVNPMAVEEVGMVEDAMAYTSIDEPEDTFNNHE
jgi:hypothetical protein